MENIKQLKKFWSKKKVFITGHTGFKGTWLSIILNYLNSSIHGYSLKPKQKSLFNKSNILQNLKSNTYSDINNLTKLKKKIRYCKPEIIFHLAAQPLVIDSYKNPIKTLNTNIIGTANLLECIRDIKSIKSVVIVTTDKVYKIKKNNKAYKELDQLGGIDPYSASKVGTEIVVESYIKSFFNNSILKNKVSTARAGNVIGGGDFSTNRLLPDIIYSINNKKKLKIRNPNHIRPWQHVLDPLMGYLILAKKQYVGKVENKLHAWNFGPSKNNFKKVIDIARYIKTLQRFEYILTKNNINFRETEILKLNSLKAKKKLNWTSKWNLTKSIIKTLEWNENFKNGISAKDICERQFLMYINNYEA
jgi:CDP-glucose 4,6-dehydratase